METNKSHKIPFFSTALPIVFLGAGASIAGSLAMHLGGFIASLGTTLLIAVLCGIFYQLQSNKNASINEREDNTRRKSITIPDDRIDPLTGLANENGLLAWLAENRARIIAEGKAILILTADLDDIALVERTYGRETADAVLIEIAHRITQCAGQDGLAARTANEGFAAISTIIPSSAKEIAAKQAGKLTEMIQRPVELQKSVVWIGGFVGAATGSITDATTVLNNARKALKQAQALGRGHFKIFSKEK